MDFTVRSLEARDFPACLALLRGRLAYPADKLTGLARAWRRLLREDALDTCVIESRQADGTEVVVGFGASVFVTDEWAADARSGEEPYLTMRTVQRELDGRSPILRPRAIRRDNETGLNVLILHYGEAPELRRDAKPALRFRMFQALVESLRGYRLKDVVQEFWDEIDHEYIVHGWGRVLTDYASFFRRRGEAVPGPGRGPHLIGVTREQCLATPGGLAAPLFVHAPPRLSLTRAEQRMLGQALSGKTDVALARFLRLAVPTIKSRWRGIYNRVAAIDPELLSTPLSRDASSRGQEKRRRLLEYLRRHPEELRSPLSSRKAL